jgi:transposase-like protein
MAKKRFSPEQIVAKPREIEVLLGPGKALAQACREAGITDVTYYRWRREYGGLSRARGARGWRSSVTPA